MAEQITNKVLEMAYDEILKKNMAKYRDAGKKAMREVRKSIVDSWFGEFNSVSMNAATEYYANTVKLDNKHVRLIVRSWVNPRRYNYYQRIQEWREKRAIWSSPHTAVNYVLNLQLEEGIIGLPEKGSKPVPIKNRPFVRTGWLDDSGYWHNDHFHERPFGLRETIENSSKWSNGEFLQSFYKFIGKGA